MPADRAKISAPPPRHPHEHGGIERIALRAVAPLSGAHPLSLFARRFFHSSPREYVGRVRSCQPSLASADNDDSRHSLHIFRV